MFSGRQYSFQAKQDELGVLAYIPSLPLILSYQNSFVEVMGLLDTRASIRCY